VSSTPFWPAATTTVSSGTPFVPTGTTCTSSPCAMLSTAPFEPGRMPSGSVGFTSSPAGAVSSTPLRPGATTTSSSARPPAPTAATCTSSPAAAVSATPSGPASTRCGVVRRSSRMSWSRKSSGMPAGRPVPSYSDRPPMIVPPWQGADVPQSASSTQSSLGWSPPAAQRSSSRGRFSTAAVIARQVVGWPSPKSIDTPAVRSRTVWRPNAKLRPSPVTRS